MESVLVLEVTWLGAPSTITWDGRILAHNKILLQYYSFKASWLLYVPPVYY
jgi:hypothetical protein